MMVYIGISWFDPTDGKVLYRMQVLADEDTNILRYYFTAPHLFTWLLVLLSQRQGEHNSYPCSSRLVELYKK